MTAEPGQLDLWNGVLAHLAESPPRKVKNVKKLKNSDKFEMLHTFVNTFYDIN